MSKMKVLSITGLDKFLFNVCDSQALPLHLFSTIFTGWVPTLLRAGRGMTLWNKAGAVPAEKLELFSYENNSVRNRCSHCCHVTN